MNCRLCGTRTEKVMELAKMPIGDAYLEEAREQAEYETTLYLCPACGLAQLPQIINPDDIYRPYIYKTSDSLGLVEHFQRYADAIYTSAGKPKNGLAIDIGSNDGTLLSFLKAKGMSVLGIDPARDIAEQASQRGIETLPDFFNLELARKILASRGQARIITTNNTIANIDDVKSFVMGIKELLSGDGLFAFETGYALDLVGKTIFDNIYHEHLSYFSLKPLDKFFSSIGMTLVNVHRIDTKGGSIRCIVKNGRSEQSQYLKELLSVEEDLGIHKPEAFYLFKQNLDLLKSQLIRIVKHARANGKSLAGYGASVGVTTVVYNYDLGRGMLDFLVDDNPTRQGLVSPGYHIPVLSPKDLLKRRPDYVVILAWQYAKPIMERNKDYLESGGRFILIHPQVRVVDRHY